MNNKVGVEHQPDDMVVLGWKYQYYLGLPPTQ